ncbi:hypothetical protein LF599_04285 [Pseudodesulfovibrio thermohalotolerans]|uniref:hypothetical protein n=1 Tax=Pseudodesulfovibrio thermohalotolerans TaxID=2880651 RepID=UPI0024436A01|nr:hypothetical protein [Pseudodesulfovibrio thermohalotolerans]WFS63390.1 hypothetical protein LF599_04285 [Pseudodesulfovibrio thermohalotolerans]
MKLKRKGMRNKCGIAHQPAKQHWPRKLNIEDVRTVKEKSQELFAGMVGTVFPLVTCGLQQIPGLVKQRLGGWILVLSSLLLLVYPIAAASEGNIDAAVYLGPLPGIRFFYETDGGQKMELRGLTYDQEGALLIEEKSLFPTRWAAFNAGCTTELSTIYGVLSNGSKLLKKGFPLNGMTGYETDLDLEEPAWGIEITLAELGTKYSGAGKKTTSRCSITKRSKQKLFGKERTIIEVSGAYCIPRKYASGIGLIEYAGFKLVRIEDHGNLVYESR